LCPRRVKTIKQTLLSSFPRHDERSEASSSDGGGLGVPSFNSKQKLSHQSFRLGMTNDFCAHEIRKNSNINNSPSFLPVVPSAPFVYETSARDSRRFLVVQTNKSRKTTTGAATRTIFVGRTQAKTKKQEPHSPSPGSIYFPIPSLIGREEKEAPPQAGEGNKCPAPLLWRGRRAVAR